MFILCQIRKIVSTACGYVQDEAFLSSILMFALAGCAWVWNRCRRLAGATCIKLSLRSVFGQLLRMMPVPWLAWPADVKRTFACFGLQIVQVNGITLILFLLVVFAND